jgi:hypothetical protein
LGLWLRRSCSHVLLEGLPCGLTHSHADQLGHDAVSEPGSEDLLIDVIHHVKVYLHGAGQKPLI